MQSPSGLGFDDGAQTSLAGFALLVLASCLGWRCPTFLWLVALASLAVRPEGAFDLDVEMGYEWGVQYWLIALALVASALRHGIRWTVNWPIRRRRAASDGPKVREGLAGLNTEPVLAEITEVTHVCAILDASLRHRILDRVG